MLKKWLNIGLLAGLLCAWSSYSQSNDITDLNANLISSWQVTLDGDARTRTLRIKGVTQKSANAYVLDADYGYSDAQLAPVKAEIVQQGDACLLTLITPANSTIAASRSSGDSFSGSFTGKNGSSKAVTLTRLRDIPSGAQQAAGPRVHIIWMGGDDCPYCREWRANELPKLEQSPEFKKVKFSDVQKSIKSSVPARFFLPDDVAVYKDKLDKASAGHAGSPQVAIMVNDEVFDYFFMPRKAVDIEKMLLAIRSGTEYPFTPCIQFSPQWGRCATYGKSWMSSREISAFLQSAYGIAFQPTEPEKSRWECPEGRISKPSGNTTRNWVCRRHDPSFMRLIVWGIGDGSRHLIETDNFNAMAGGKGAQRGEPSCRETPWSGNDGKPNGTVRDCMLPLPNGEFYASFFHFKHRNSHLTLLVRNASSTGSTPKVAEDLRQWIGDLLLND